MTSRPPASGAPSYEAAMEPAHQERDDATDAHDGNTAASVPQWSPLTRSGMTAFTTPLTDRVIVPQWSPLTRSGMTSRALNSVEDYNKPQWSPLTRSGMTWPP